MDEAEKELREEYARRAEKVGYKFPSNISTDTLKENVEEREAKAAKEAAEKAKDAASSDGATSDDGANAGNQPGGGASKPSDKPKTKQPKKAKVQASEDVQVKVHCVIPGGRRRGGRRWDGGDTLVPLEEWSDALEAALTADPMFTIEKPETN